MHTITTAQGSNYTIRHLRREFFIHPSSNHELDGKVDLYESGRVRVACTVDGKDHRFDICRTADGLEARSWEIHTGSGVTGGELLAKVSFGSQHYQSKELEQMGLGLASSMIGLPLVGIAAEVP